MIASRVPDRISHLRRLLIASSCLLALGQASGAAARSLIPERPSVEVNLDALDDLRPAPPVYYAPVPGAGGARRVPVEQPGTPGQPPGAGLPHRHPAHRAPKPATAKPAPMPEVAVPVLDALPTPAKSVPPEKPIEAPKTRAKPVVPAVAKKPAAPIRPPAALPEIAPPALPPPPAPPAMPELVPSAVPLAKAPPKAPAMAVAKTPPAQPLPTPPPVALPPLLPAMPVSKPATAKVAAPIPVPAAVPELPLPPPPMLPAVGNKPAAAAGAAPSPDISKLDFSHFPTATPAMPVPAPAAKPTAVAPDIMPLPLAPVINAPSIPKAATSTPAPVLVPGNPTSPLMVPVPKEPPSLPPSVNQRMDSMYNSANDKQGILSDTTKIKNANEIQKPLSGAQNIPPVNKSAAAAKPVADAVPTLSPAPPARQDKGLGLDLLPPPPLPSVAGAPATKTGGSPLDMDALPPAVLPPIGNALPSPGTAAPVLPNKPAAAANADTAPATPIKLPKDTVAALPKLTPMLPPVPLPNDLPKPPSAKPTNAAEELPPSTLPSAAPATAGSAALPSLDAITGDRAKTSSDVVRESISAKPLASTALPLLPAPEGPVVKRELPEISVGKKSSVAPESALPVVTHETAKPAPPAAVEKTKAAGAKPVAAPDAAIPPLLPAVAAAKPNANALPPLALVPGPAAAASANDAAAPAKITRSLSFDKDKIELSDDAKSDLNDIADKLKQGNGQVRVVAYASGTPEQAAVARRISLSRALAVRAFLMGKGVNQLSINVQAQGNQVPSGDADRADVFLK